MEQWNCLHLDVSRSVEEAVCALCHEAGSCGISIREDADTTHLEVFFPIQIDLNLIFGLIRNNGFFSSSFLDTSITIIRFKIPI